MFRWILEQVGVGDKVYLSHSNNHGSQTVTREMVRTLFRGIPDLAVKNLVRSLRPDFEICGYQETLEWIENTLQ